MTRKKELSLSIGQVIYVLSNKPTIIPAKVVEEATIQTLEGKCVSWKLAIGKKEEQETIDYKEVDGEIYLTLKEVKTELAKRLNGFIKDLVEKAKNRELSWFGDDEQQQTTTSASKTKTKTKTKVAKQKKSNLREELKKISTPTEEEMIDKPEERKEGTAMVTLLDGTKVPINLPNETNAQNNG
jgi:hypothetical protein